MRGQTKPWEKDDSLHHPASSSISAASTSTLSIIHHAQHPHLSFAFPAPVELFDSCSSTRVNPPRSPIWRRGRPQKRISKGPLTSSAGTTALNLVSACACSQSIATETCYTAKEDPMSLHSQEILSSSLPSWGGANLCHNHSAHRPGR